MKVMGWQYEPANNNRFGFLCGFIGGIGQFFMNINLQAEFYSKLVEAMITAALCGFVGMLGKELFVLTKKSLITYFKSLVKRIKMANVKFGFSQIGAATPKSATWIFRVVLYSAAAATLVVNTIVEIPEPVQVAVGKYSVYAVALVHGFSKLFGIDLSNSQPPTVDQTKK